MEPRLPCKPHAVCAVRACVCVYMRVRVCVRVTLALALSPSPFPALPFSQLILPYPTPSLQLLQAEKVGDTHVQIETPANPLDNGTMHGVQPNMLNMSFKAYVHHTTPHSCIDLTEHCCLVYCINVQKHTCTK